MKIPQNADALYRVALNTLKTTLAEQFGPAAIFASLKYGILAWRSAGGLATALAFFAYSPAAFRLSTLHVATGPCRSRRAYHCFELSFAPEEIQAVAGDFVRFTESAYAHADDPEAIWRWPLFARPSQTSFPHYAWSHRWPRRPRCPRGCSQRHRGAQPQTAVAFPYEK
jgi:hypothetical protein